MRQNASSTSTLARPQLRSPSPSDMDPTDANDEDRQPPAETLLKRPASPAAAESSAAEYPSPPQRVTKPHHVHERDGTDKGAVDSSRSASKLNTTFRATDKESRFPSSSPPTASHSATPRPSFGSPYNTIIMHTKRSEPPAIKTGEKRRPARMPYTAEQDDFIRFVRDDLSLSWEVSALFYNDYWHADGDGKREIPGLQSRYYRLLEQPMRDRKRKVDVGPMARRNKESKDSLGRPEEGILAKTNRRYYWMEGMFETEEERRAAKMEMASQDDVMEPSSKRQRTDAHDARDHSENTDQDDDDDDYDDEESPEDTNEHHMYADGSSSGSHDDETVVRRHSARSTANS